MGPPRDGRDHLGLQTRAHLQAHAHPPQPMSLDQGLSGLPEVDLGAVPLLSCTVDYYHRNILHPHVAAKVPIGKR